MKSRRSPIRVTIGASLLLVIFVVLCLAAFAALSMASAGADYRLSKKSAERTSQFYQANNLAQDRLAELNELIESAYASADSQDAYLSAILHCLSE